MYVFLWVMGERIVGERKQEAVRDLTLVLMFLRLFTNKAQKYAGLKKGPGRDLKGPENQKAVWLQSRATYMLADSWRDCFSLADKDTKQNPVAGVGNTYLIKNNLL